MVDLNNYDPTYVTVPETRTTKYRVTATEWNALWAAICQQTNITSEALATLISRLIDGLFSDTGASYLKTAALPGTTATNVAEQLAWLKASMDSLAPTTPVETTAAIDYYVSPTGLDTNNGLSAGTPFKTIQHALDLVPKKLNHPVQIHLVDGTYDESISIDSFTGKSNLILIGNLTTPANCKITHIDVYGCVANIQVQGVYITKFVEGSSFSQVNVYNSKYVRFTYTTLQCSNVPKQPGSRGLTAVASFVYVGDSTMSDFDVILSAQYGSIIDVEYCSGANNSTLIFCGQGSIYHKLGGIPTATTETSNAGTSMLL